MGKALEAIEKPKAKQRQKESGESYGRGKKIGSVKFTEPIDDHEEIAPSTLDEHSGHHRQVRDIVGAALGVSGPTYQRMKAVAEAAEEDPETIDERLRRAVWGTRYSNCRVAYGIRTPKS